MNWKLLFLILWSITAGISAFGLATGTKLEFEVARYGMTIQRDPDTRRFLIEAVEPNGPAERAGLQPGDKLDFPTGDAVTLSVRKPGLLLDIGFDRDGIFHSGALTSEAEEKDAKAIFDGLYGAWMSLLFLSSSLLIGGARSKAQSLRWIALMLLTLEFLNIGLLASPTLSRISNSLANTALVVAPILMLKFWITFSEEQAVPIEHGWRQWTWFLVLPGSMFAAAVVGTRGLDHLLSQSVGGASSPYLEWYLLLSSSIDPLWMTWGVLGFGSCVLLAWQVLRRSRGGASNEAYWAAASLLALFISPLGFFIGSVIMAAGGVSLTTREAVADFWHYLTLPLATLCILAFVYQSLRRRMISFEFVVNRTVVYLFTGAILVAIFWLVKRNIESMGYVNDNAQDVMLSGALAVLAFLAKQLRGTADEALKRLIFVNFNRRETRLKAFKLQMGHHKTQAALDEGAVKALQDFCHGARIDLLLWDGQRYVADAERWVIPVDHELPLMLRARRVSFTPEFASVDQAFRVRLAIPAFLRSDLLFFVVIHDSEDLPVFRPDEVRQMEDLVAQWVVERSLLELDGLKSKGDHMIWRRGLG